MLNGDTALLPVVIAAGLIVIDAFLVRFNAAPKIRLARRFLASTTVYAVWIVTSAWLLSLFGLLVPVIWRLTTVLAITLGLIIFLALEPEKSRLLHDNLLADCVRAWRGQNRTVKLLTAAVGLWAAFGFLRIALLPPTTNDALSDHLVMSATWLQEGSFIDFATYHPHIAMYPINGHILTMFHLAFSSDNAFAEIVQLEAWLVLLVASYGLVRLFGVDRVIAIGTALVTGSMPVLLTQSTSSFIDISALAWFALFGFFLADAFLTSADSSIILCGAALGLLIGSKEYGVLIIPAGCVVTILWFAVGANPRKNIWRFLALFLPLFILMAFPRYLQNALRFGSFVYLNPGDTPNAGLQISHLTHNLFTGWPEIFFDTPWSLFEFTAWQQHTACFGLPFTFIALPLAVGGLAEIDWKAVKNWYHTPLPIFAISISYLLLFGLVFYRPGGEATGVRWMMIAPYGVICFAGWSLSRITQDRRLLTVVVVVVFSVLLLTISGWLLGSWLRRAATTVLSVAGIAAVAATYRGYLKGQIYRNAAVFGLMLVVTGHYILSAVYDFRSSAAMMALAVQTSPDRRYTAMFQTWLEPSDLPVWVDRLVPENAYLTIYNEDRAVYFPYAFFGPEHGRKVRCLVNWNAANDLTTGSQELARILQTEYQVWLLVPATSQHIEQLLERQEAETKFIGEHSSGWRLWLLRYTPDESF